MTAATDGPLVRRAIHAEAARLPGAGDPLHAGMVTFLLVRGANPQAPGKPAEAEAELLGHWLATEIIRAWDPTAAMAEISKVYNGR
jgi:hypothetical protein